FQAEDGIRDYKVTGVQTCALPISGTASRRADPDRRDAVPVGLGPADARPLCARADHHRDNRRAERTALPRTDARDDARLRAGGRSEERRVGKECRGRWSPYGWKER